jgi:hypothetical protein
MATLSDLRTYLARDLRDESNSTWSTAALDDFINRGIDSLADFYPREITSDLGTVSASVQTYSASSFMSIYQVDLWSGTTYKGEVPATIGGSADDGWRLRAGIFYMPAGVTFPTGLTIRAFGYGRYTQLAASTSTTDLDASGIAAVLIFAQAEALARLTTDRAQFSQWAAQPGNTDTGLLAINQAVNLARGRWREEQRRLRRMRRQSNG